MLEDRVVSKILRQILEVYEIEGKVLTDIKGFHEQMSKCVILTGTVRSGF